MKLGEECGLFGVYGSSTSSRDMYLGLHAQQHRGQESAGMVVGDPGGPYRQHKELGLVTNAFDEEQLERLQGSMGIGHVRYSTAGSVTAQDAQPLRVTHHDRLYAISHNGNLTNAALLRNQLESDGAVFSTTSDTEVVLHNLLRAEATDPVEKVRAGLRNIKGAYSLLIMFDEGIVAVRDPHGFRPLYVGRKGQRYYFASETCGFDILNAEPVAEIDPGEGYFISGAGLETFQLHTPPERRMCSFEAVYFSRPDSLYKDESVHQFRVRMGRKLWEEHPVEADLVTGVPDSANSAVLGYAEASGLPHEITLIRSHYTGRTFIAPYQSMRDLEVRKKFNLVPDLVEDQRVVVVDDSIVRGTTSSKIAQMFRDRGAREIHLRIAAPSIANPCYFGIDIPNRDELVVNRVPREELADHLGVDSVEYLSAEALIDITGEDTCRGCFTGNYPVDVDAAENGISKEPGSACGEHVRV